MTESRALVWLGLALAAAAAACGSSGAKSTGDQDASEASVVSVDAVSLDMASGPDGHDAGATDGSAEALGDGAVLITPDLCNQKCNLIAQISCPGSQTLDHCVSACLSGGSSCDVERLAYYQCLLAAGAQSLMCDTILQAVVLKDGVCTQQSNDYFDCA
jgi:hypothetical protein